MWAPPPGPPLSTSPPGSARRLARHAAGAKRRRRTTARPGRCVLLGRPAPAPPRTLRAVASAGPGDEDPTGLMRPPATHDEPLSGPTAESAPADGAPGTDDESRTTARAGGPP